MIECYDAVVIGSGFGGSINSLRLAQAGKSTLVLERGKRYKPGNFPRDATNVNEVFWRYPRIREAQGLYDVRFLSSLATIAASGVGGGSLIYSNVHIRPDPVVFESDRWPRSISCRSLDKYYDIVAKTLDVSPLPEESNVPVRRYFRKAAAALQRTIFDPDQAVSWKQPSDPARQACQLCAECELGCQFGAKNTLDFTYLAAAERLGTRIQPGAWVSHIEPATMGYRVHFVDLTTGEKKVVNGSRVVVSAGTLGTNEILLRSRDITWTLPRLSRRLGCGYSANGDFLATIRNTASDLHPWEAPAATSLLRYCDSTPPFMIAASTFNQATMRILASVAHSDLRRLRPLSGVLWPAMSFALLWSFKLGLMHHLARLHVNSARDPSRMMNLFAVGRDNANGEIRLRNGRLDIVWNYAQENAKLIQKMTCAMREISEVYGGSFAPLLNWTLFKRIITAHPLGGCRLSDSAEHGVVSPRGEVHSYPGLFVADGSVIPTSLGFPPAMTISALSERIAQAVVDSYSSSSS
jgi:cholesterol oxidase